MTRASVVPGMLVTVVLAACGAAGEEPLTVSDVTVFAPLPGQSTAVAYFTLENSSSTTVTLHEVSSPDFAAVEMHATVHDDGVAEMLPLDAVTVAEASRIVFSAGESHLMLIEPSDRTQPGDTVTIEFHYEMTGMENGGTLSISAPVSARGLQ